MKYQQATDCPKLKLHDLRQQGRPKNGRYIGDLFSTDMLSFKTTNILTTSIVNAHGLARNILTSLPPAAEVLTGCLYPHARRALCGTVP